MKPEATLADLHRSPDGTRRAPRAAQASYGAPGERPSDSLPTWRMLVFDGTFYLSAFAPSSEGHRSGMYKLTAAGDGVLHAGFLRQFDDMWRQARQEDRR